MNNINSKNYSINSTKPHKWKNLGYALMLTTLFNLNNPAEAKNYTTINDYKPNLEIIDTPDIINNIEKRTWIILPHEYHNKLKTFVETNEVMKSKNWVKFTEDFIVNQMEYDWWIDKQNQLLFIWFAVYEQITWEYFYDWSDGDDNRLEEFSNVMDKVEQCWKEYVTWINTYMEEVSTEADRMSAEYRQQSAEYRQQSAEYRQQSAEYRQQSAEAIKKIMEQDSIRLKKSMIEFYEISIRSQNSIKKEDIDFAKESTKTIIEDCKKYWIDYRAILLKEVWDMKKVDAILKFYEIE